MFSAKPEIPRSATYWIAFSGGLDSTVLLHRLRAEGLRPLRAIHVHHGLQNAADDWVRHCRKICRSLKVPLTVERVRVAESGRGPEAAAREARYAAFRGHLRDGDCLVTAHHRDDQAETMLLRLLRGAGVQGLAGLRALDDFPAGRMPAKLWRPLLETPRAELLAYARRHRLRWVEDPHNRDPRYTRAWLRQSVMPLLRRRQPALDQLLARSARHCAEAQVLLDELAMLDLAAAGEGASLRVSALLALTAARRSNLLRHWLQTAGCEPPPAHLLHRLEAELLRARPDAAPVLAWGDHELRRYRDHLHVMSRLPPVPEGVHLGWNGCGRLRLPTGCGVLAGRSRKPVGGLHVRFPQGGERLRPIGQRHHRTLKQIFQEAGVPPWVRQRTPLVFLGEELVAVADFVASDTAKKRGLQLKWVNPLGAF